MFDTPILAAFTLLFLALAFMLGGSIASFLGVVKERVPRGESINGVSHCVCGRNLRWYENVPVFGWLRIRGTARCCGARIPAWYALSELAAGLVSASIVFALLYLLLG